MAAHSFALDLSGSASVSTASQDGGPGSSSSDADLGGPLPGRSPFTMIRRALVEGARKVAKPTGGVVFVSGSLCGTLRNVAAEVSESWPGVPTVVIPAAGVLSEDEEIEATTAASGLIWSGGRSSSLVIEDTEDVGPGLRDALAEQVGERAGTLFLAVGAPGLESDDLAELGAAAPNVSIFGGGASRRTVIGVDATGAIREGGAAGLLFSGLGPPLIDASPACRVVSPFHEVREASNGMLLQLDAGAALDVLSSYASDLRSASEGQPVVFAAISVNDDDSSYLVRPVRGIDPSRRGIMLGQDAVTGAKVAFGVRDPGFARKDLERAARRVERGSQGAAPRFMMYMSCAGRGQGLYGSPSVDVRILRRQFPNVPIVGMHSSFEVVSHQPGNVHMQLFSGVIALFRSLS